MDRTDGLGTGVAVAGHVALFGALSLGVAASIPPKPVPPPSMDVSFVEEVALEAAAPVAEPMAAAKAPELGTPEEAMPQPAPVAEPLPLAPEPEPVPAPAPKPKPVKQAAAPKPEPPKPVPVKRAVAKPAPADTARAKAAKAKAEQAKLAEAKAARAKATAAAKQKAADKLAAAAGKGDKTVQRGKRLGKDFLAGIDSASEGKSTEAAAPAITKNAMAAIQAAIKRQIQPCANRQVNPGPGASRIVVKLNLRLNKDGSLASSPKVASFSGIDDENSRYQKRVADLAIAAYTGCAPMKGLPVDLYRTAKGGWNNVNMNYKLPG